MIYHSFLVTPQIRRGPSILQPSANHHPPRQSERSQTPKSSSPETPSSAVATVSQIIASAGRWARDGVFDRYHSRVSHYYLVTSLLIPPENSTSRREAACTRMQSTPHNLPPASPHTHISRLLAHDSTSIVAVLLIKEVASVRLLLPQPSTAVAPSRPHPFCSRDV
jgi:hypothetical protein